MIASLWKVVLQLPVRAAGMSDPWAFLSDPVTQATLSWLGGGLVVRARPEDRPDVAYRPISSATPRRITEDSGPVQ
jgi:hypothetical protein